MGWVKNKNWRKLEISKNIFLMREHNWAFAAWEIARLEGLIKGNSVLVHVDAHLDDVIDGIYVNGILDGIKTKSDALHLAEAFDYCTGVSPEKAYLRIDNFIWPAIVRNTIDYTFYVSTDDQQENTFELLKNESENFIDLERNREDIVDVKAAKFISNLEIENKGIFRSFTLDEFINNQYKDFIEVSEGRDKILDIDLDFFVNEIDNQFSLKSEKDITNSLLTLKNLVKWDLITVALSPDYCGGAEQCEYILSLFYEYFSIDPNTLVDW